MAECDAVCEHAHLPLQSGSTRVLKAMRRTYAASATCGSSRDSARAIPTCALTTDIIVGFPARPSDDFARDARGRARRSATTARFTFVYSPRQGTEAATMPDQVPDEVKRERIERLVELVQQRRGRAQRVAGRPRRGGARRRPEPDGSLGAARAHAPQHDRQFRGDERSGQPRRGPHRRRNLDDASRRRAGSRCSVVATSSGTAAQRPRPRRPSDRGRRRRRGTT